MSGNGSFANFRVWRDVAAEAAIGYGREGDRNLGRWMRIMIATALSATIRQTERRFAVRRQDCAAALNSSLGQGAGRLAVILTAEASLQVGHDGPDVGAGVLGPEVVDGLAQFRFCHLLWAI